MTRPRHGWDNRNTQALPIMPVWDRLTWPQPRVTDEPAYDDGPPTYAFTPRRVRGAHREALSIGRRLVNLAALLVTLVIQLATEWAWPRAVRAWRGLLALRWSDVTYWCTEARDWCRWTRDEWRTWTPAARLGVALAVGIPVSGLLALALIVWAMFAR